MSGQIFKMIDVSRHRSVETLPGYVRDAELRRGWAARDLRWRGSPIASR
jgi:hypothetical protein